MKKSPLFLSALFALTLATGVAADSAFVGKPLPEIKVVYLGAKPELAGKPILLEFWATWCPPCRESIPHLNGFYKKYKDKGLMIVGVTDEDAATVNKFTQKVPIEYFAATDKGGNLSKQFNINGIPHAFLVNKEGKIVWEGHPMQLTEADIEKVL